MAKNATFFMFFNFFITLEQDTKVGLAKLIWDKADEKVPLEEQQVGQWEVLSYDPKLVTFPQNSL